MSRLTVALALVASAVAARPVWADPTLARQTELPTYSLFDADSLGEHRVAFAFGVGFPYVQGMAGVDLIDGVDLDLNIDSLYGVVTIFSLGPKVRLARSGGVSVAVELQAQAAWFREPETTSDGLGARQITGARNFDFQPQLILSYRGHYGSLFGALSYQGTFDTEPVSNGPLAGTPPAWTYGSNLGGRLGLEFAAFGFVHPYGVIGLNVQTRSGDDPVMVLAELGFAFPT